MDLANRVPIAVLEFCNGVVEGVMKSHRLFANVWFEAQYAASVASMSGVGHCSESGRQWSAIARRLRFSPSTVACSCCPIEGVFRSRQGMVVTEDWRPEVLWSVPKVSG